MIPLCITKVPSGLRIQVSVPGRASMALLFVVFYFHLSCADLEGGRGPDPPSLANYKSIGFLSNSGPDPLKTAKLPIQHSVLCWVIIGPPVKRHLNGVSLAGR